MENKVLIIGPFGERGGREIEAGFFSKTLAITKPIIKHTIPTPIAMIITVELSILYRSLLCNYLYKKSLH